MWIYAKADAQGDGKGGGKGGEATEAESERERERERKSERSRLREREKDRWKERVRRGWEGGEKAEWWLQDHVGVHLRIVSHLGSLKAFQGSVRTRITKARLVYTALLAVGRRG